MSESLAVGGAVASPHANARVQPALPDPRRKLQLGLGVVWLLDGFLQLQPFMFGKGFPQMLAGNASGNPAFVASPITWSAGFIEHHLVALNAVFAFIQLALGLGIAWRPTVKLALGASVPWALGVWWVGEGLGGVLAGNASPVAGAPGAVFLYALLAVLLWPADRDPRGVLRRRPCRGPAGARAPGWWCGRAWRPSPCSPPPARRRPSAA